MEGTKQFIVPLFQRTYNWSKKEWKVLWDDLVELMEMETPRTHFIGSIVNMPDVPVPEGVTKFLLIDGQQRMTTIFVLLAIVRDVSMRNKNTNFADEINNTLLVNPYKDGNNKYKLFPTQADRQSFIAIIDRGELEESAQISMAYNYFKNKIEEKYFDLEKFKHLITNYISLVSIVLDNSDNPYLVFESLNAKGRPLTQSDLIKNYLFMRIRSTEQNEIFLRFWKPMEDRLEDDLTEFIRHYLMKGGKIVKLSEVYDGIKSFVNSENVLTVLEDLSKYSIIYKKLLAPENEEDSTIRKYLYRLNRIDATTVYPLLLNYYALYNEKVLIEDDLVKVLKVIENYLIRRFVCNYQSNELNKIFPNVLVTLISEDNLLDIDGLKMLLSKKRYPKDITFDKYIKENNLYGAGDRNRKTKLILESIEEYFGHKEQSNFETLSIEHIMPQTLNKWWIENLGNDKDHVHELLLNTIGNLTLTGYNSNLSNENFDNKKLILKNSHLELNKYFEIMTTWKAQEILQRSAVLSEIMQKIWPYLGPEIDLTEELDVTGKKPLNVYLLGQYLPVSNWRGVFEKTISALIDLDPDNFKSFTELFPNYFSYDKTKLREFRKLKNGCYLEVNLSAKSIDKICRQAIYHYELQPEDWRVVTE